MVAHTCNPNTQEAEVGLLTVPDQPRDSETLTD